MKKEFIPYEQALALKELGFNEPCFGYYFGNKKFSIIKEYEIGIFDKNSTTNRYDGIGERPTAILYQQAFRWFRKEHEYIIPIEEKWFSNTNNVKYQFRCPNTDKLFKYDTYEEAELECLKKLIEIVKN